MDMMMKTSFDKEKLKLGEFIAHGSFGAVYQGDYDGQKVAVKALDFKGDRKEEMYFRQEASLWSTLDHPNVAKFIGVTKLTLPSTQEGDQKQYWCMVSEFLEGGMVTKLLNKTEFLDGGVVTKLLKKMRKKKKLPFKRVIELGLDVARGLAYLHSQKVVHRDVKTQNIVLDDQGRAKLIDFGLSRKEASNPSEMTGFTGTELYMAPEVRSCKPYDHKCDVYSFGLILWEMFHCQTVPVETLRSKKPRIVGECPDKLVDLMLHCWVKKEGRPEMSEVVKTLEEILEETLELEAKRRNKFRGCFN